MTCLLHSHCESTCAHIPGHGWLLDLHRCHGKCAGSGSRAWSYLSPSAFPGWTTDFLSAAGNKTQVKPINKSAVGVLEEKKNWIDMNHQELL